MLRCLSDDKVHAVKDVDNLITEVLKKLSCELIFTFVCNYTNRTSNKSRLFFNIFNS